MVSKKVFSAVLVTVMILSVIGGSTAAFAQQTTMVTRTTTTTTITQTAQGAPDLSTLVKLLLLATNFSGNRSAAQVLNETGNYTVLAPTNEAFAALNNTTLADIQSNHTRLNDVLGYHVIAQPVDLTVNGTKAYTTVDSKQLNITVNGTTVTAGSGNNTATLSKTSINTSNGRVYTIDKVLTPPAGAVSISTAAASPAAGAFGLPGFEAVYAVAGLLAVAYLVLRRRK
ncbi:MAG: fasciclin domain-containing protein [Halobacteriota archaeon]